MKLNALPTLKIALWGFFYALTLLAQPMNNRKALLIVNGHYSPLPPLVDSLSGQAPLADTLLHAGFDVKQVTDLAGDALVDTIERFSQRLQTGDVCLFYYSGYGMRHRNDNYLVPIDFDPANPPSWRRYHALTTGVLN
jgi:uncharacterized caspase-like protein